MHSACARHGSTIGSDIHFCVCRFQFNKSAFLTVASISCISTLFLFQLIVIGVIVWLSSCENCYCSVGYLATFNCEEMIKYPTIHNTACFKLLKYLIFNTCFYTCFILFTLLVYYLYDVTVNK